MEALKALEGRRLQKVLIQDLDFTTEECQIEEPPGKEPREGVSEEEQ